MLLSMWVSHSPPGVSAFLNVPSSVSYLVAQICSNEHDDNEYLLQGMCAFLLALCVHFNDDSVEAYSKDNLKQLLVKRIGLETFIGKLGEVSKHEMYSRAAKQPQIRAKSMGELLLDYEFCKLFKGLESEFKFAYTFCLYVHRYFCILLCTNMYISRRHHWHIVNGSAAI